MEKNLKVSAIMCTYGRFHCVQRSLSMFLDQTYDNKDLIIFNTAGKSLELNNSLKNENIKIINQSISTETNKPYTNIGEVRRDSLKHMDGEVYICWDDDDYYMPFHIEQGINYLNKSGKLAWKPKKSYFSYDGGLTYDLVSNNMEASILVKKEIFNLVKFNNGTGDEHNSWLSYLRKNNQIEENQNITPFESYAYIWGDGEHKQSGNMKNPNNFEEHKKYSIDFGNKPLSYVECMYLYEDMYKFNNFNIKLKNLIDKCYNTHIKYNIVKQYGDVAQW